MDFLSLNSNALQSRIFDRLDELEEKLRPLFKYIKNGTLLRDKKNEDYCGRVAYTAELRRFVYNPAIFNEILMLEALKEKFFRVFGYQNNLDFTLYPNAWIRDLALNDFAIGRGVYLADGIVLGTNQVSPCQKKLKVGPIKIGNATVFDQNCKIGLRTNIGERCIIGISCHIGLISRIGNNVKISPLSSIGHLVKIEDNVVIGAQCTIGTGSIIEEGAVIADYTKIPQRSFVSHTGKIDAMDPAQC